MTLAGANREFRSALDAAERALGSAQAADDELRSMERLLNAIELHLGSGRRDITDGLRLRLHEASACVSTRAPVAVATATSGRRLHKAVLAWQGRLLDRVSVHRLEVSDRFD